MSDSRKRILLFAEAVTLAHVARPLAFAAGLARDSFHVAIATAEHASNHVRNAGFEHIVLNSIAPAAFLRALAAGKPLYDVATLARYVEDDLRIIEAFRPDLIAGDFRLSLSVSARLAKVPYATIASAYWSPFYEPPMWPVPSLPLTRTLPLAVAQRLFSTVRPLAFWLHCRPLNAVRRRYGLAALDSDLRRIYTDADHVLYSDLAALFPMTGLPRTHRFLGPALWEPVVQLPPWWGELPADLPIVYVTFGSSGDSTLLPRVLDALAELPVTLIAASAGRRECLSQRGSVFVANYLPGMQAARCARLVVGNGGSLTAYQALAAGVPVLGIAGNLDQFLNMQAIERAGAGATLRADQWSPDRLKQSVLHLLDRPDARTAARRIKALCVAQDFEQRACDFVGQALATAPNSD